MCECLRVTSGAVSKRRLTVRGMCCGARLCWKIRVQTHRGSVKGFRLRACTVCTQMAHNDNKSFQKNSSKSLFQQKVLVTETIDEFVQNHYRKELSLLFFREDIKDKECSCLYEVRNSPAFPLLRDSPTGQQPEDSREGGKGSWGSYESKFGSGHFTTNKKGFSFFK